MEADLPLDMRMLGHGRAILSMGWHSYSYQNIVCSSWYWSQTVFGNLIKSHTSINSSLKMKQDIYSMPGRLSSPFLPRCHVISSSRSPHWAQGTVPSLIGGIRSWHSRKKKTHSGCKVMNTVKDKAESRWILISASQKEHPRKKKPRKEQSDN